jgi:small-conductance mechanosensitive channel
MKISDFFEAYNRQIFLSVVIVVSWLLTKLLVDRSIKRLSIKFGVARERRKVIVNITNIIFFILVLIFLITIWGVDKNKLFLFFTSIITVLGIAFFAQWSILSNITSGIIVFFSHPLKLGDQVRVVDKDFFVEGKLIYISFFFMHIENELNEKITIPNSIALQKTIVIIEKEKK